MLTLRAALTNGFTGSNFEFDGTTYVTADARDVSEVEDAAAATAAGATVDATMLTARAVNTRQTKNCLPRLLSIIVADDIRHDFMLSRTQATRAQMDQGQIGSTTPVWQEIAARYVDSDFEVHPAVENHEILSDIDVSIVGQPTATAQKLMTMFRDTKKDWNVAIENFKQSGNRNPFWDFCRHNRDTFYFNEVMELYPDLNRFCDQLVPEELREDHPGTRNEDGTPGDRTTAQEYAAKRVAAKEKGKKALEGIPPGKKSAMDNKLDRSTDKVLSRTLDHLAGLFAGPSEKDASPEVIKEEREVRVEQANDTLEEIQIRKEVRRAKVFDQRLARFLKLREEIEREKLRGDSASPVLITILEKQLADVEKLLVG